MTELQPGDLIANRYRVVRFLGAGGMAAVYEAHDSARGVSIALKRSSSNNALKPTRTALFQREFAILSQLSHPLIIRAFDYGVHGDEPYYTMELLSGEDLRALAPLPWREACALLCDVASALAFIHSRRLIHRDVTARNVRRTADGRAKLLDFGALCPMGVAHEVAGTPPFVSPESLEGQPLDARSDLFSLGALAYFLLTAKHAYPASSLAELHAVWGRRVEAPSTWAAEIPEALNALVLSLLDLNPLARPGSAAEVFDRLAALAELTPGDAPEIAQAYLVTPTLVGREDVVIRFRRRMLRAERRRGSALLIEGEPGSGRSRLLTSLATEARLRGMIVAYAPGDEGRRGPFAIVKALASRLTESEPALCKAAAEGSEPLKRLGIGTPDTALPSIEADAWPELVAALTGWFLKVASGVALAMAVDDIDESDEVSLSVLAKLAEAAPSRRLLVVLTCELAPSHAALARFKHLGSSHVLQRFRASETLELLRSVFGDVPHLEGVARWVHRLAEGSPRTALELAQHLVSQRVARYEQGSWALPAQLDGLRLPENLGQALEAKIARLSAGARRLAQCLSLTADQEPLLLEEYPALFPEPEAARVFGLLDELLELLAASILVQHGTTCTFSNRSIRQALQRSIPPGQSAELHAQLARAYRSCSNQPNLLIAYHLFHSGEAEQAFSMLVHLITLKPTAAGRGRSLVRSPEGAHLCEQMFEWGHAHGAPATDLMLVGRSVLQLASVLDSSLVRHAPIILSQLERDTGLVHWNQFAHVSDPLERMRLCVREAYTERERTPEGSRGLEPVRAIQEFAICTATLAGVFARTHDPDSVVALIAPIDRLRPLSPAVDLVANVVAYTANARRGWTAGELRQRVLEQAAEPIVGIDELSRRAIRMLTLYYQGLEDAVMGLPVVFERIALLERERSYEPLAWQVRMLAHLFQGAEKQAESCRQKRDLALTGRSDVDRQLETSLAFESTAYVILGDLMALKRILPALRERAERWPGWQPHCLIAEGAYYGVRGDTARALELSQRALGLMKPGGHAAWPLAITRVVRLLVQLGRAAEGKSVAAEGLADCEPYPLVRPYVDQLEMALALAESKLGEAEVAIERARRIVARAEERGTAGILLIELYALWAQAAQNVNDVATFENASSRIGQICAKVDSAAFATKLSSLLKLSLGAGFEPLGTSPGILVKKGVVPSALGAKVRTELELCRGAEERAKRTLGIVLEQSRIKQGFLYLNQAHGPILAASRSDGPPPIETEEHVLKCLRAAYRSDEQSTETTSTGFGDRFALVVIALTRSGEIVTPGVVVLDCSGVRPKPVAESILSALARALIEAGDAMESSV